MRGDWLRQGAMTIGRLFCGGEWLLVAGVSAYNGDSLIFGVGKERMVWYMVVNDHA